MKHQQPLLQLYLRWALGASYLCAGLDRLGVWGPPGGARISWGDWQHFMTYAYQLMSFLPYKVAEFFAGVATAGEIGFGLLLVIGLWTRLAALGSGILLLLFGLSMAVAFGIQSPLNYSVFTASAASFLLSTLSGYKWSVDALRSKQ